MFLVRCLLLHEHFLAYDRQGGKFCSDISRPTHERQTDRHYVQAEPTVIRINPSIHLPSFNHMTKERARSTRNSTLPYMKTCYTLILDEYTVPMLSRRSILSCITHSCSDAVDR